MAKGDNEDNAWTLETLRQFLLAKIEANEAADIARHAASDKIFQAAFAASKELVTSAYLAADRAVQKAEVASEKRFEGVNEFRGQLADQQRTLMPRTEVEVMLRSLSDRLKTIENKESERAGKLTGSREGWGWAVGIVGLVALLISIFIALARVRP